MLPIWASQRAGSFVAAVRNLSKKSSGEETSLENVNFPGRCVLGAVRGNIGMECPSRQGGVLFPESTKPDRDGQEVRCSWPSNLPSPGDVICSVFQAPLATLPTRQRLDSGRHFMSLPHNTFGRIDPPLLIVREERAGRTKARPVLCTPDALRRALESGRL